MRTLLIALALASMATACGDEVPFSDRSSDGGGFESFAVGVFQDPAAFDDVLAEATRQQSDEQVIVIADFKACPGAEAIASPRRAEVAVEVLASTECGDRVSHRAVFVIDAQGVVGGRGWNYDNGIPDVRIVSE